jgi:hypothetical protein
MMKSASPPPPIGILGLGFLGQSLALEFSAVPESWATWHANPPSKQSFPVFHFDWNKEKSWSALPKTAVTLVLTIPPQLDSPDAEAKRLHFWGKWMQQNRPKLKRLIYISSTGVYPKRNGLWSEGSVFEADTNSGKLRLATEKILSQYFCLHVVRPGGIYGAGRGIDIRLKSGKPISVSGTPVHRIHVKDLTRVIRHLIEHPESIHCVNAVDLEAKPSWEVAQWLVENRDGFSPQMLSALDDSHYASTVSAERFISNQCMLDLGITLSFPTFREGMGFLPGKS